MVKTIRQVIARNPSVVFAYLYGSSTDAGRDDFDQFAEELENYIQSTR